VLLRLAILLLLGAVAAEAELSAPDLVRLQSPRNLLSNSSLEAVKATRPLSWSWDDGRASLQLVTEGALHGKQALAVDMPSAPGGPVAGAWQRVLATPQCTYELRAWVNLQEDRGGQVGIAVLALDAQQQPLGSPAEAFLEAPQAGWRELRVTLKAPASTCWLELRAPWVRGGGRALYDALSLEVQSGPWRRVGGPALTGLRAQEVGSNWALVVWDTIPGEFQVRYRALSFRGWSESEPLSDAYCTLLGLRPESAYEVRVSLAPEPHYGAAGAAAAPPVGPPEATRLILQTPSWAPRSWEGYQLWPTAALSTAGGEADGACIEAYKDALYVVESVHGGVYLSKVSPTDLHAEPRAPVLPPPEAAEGLDLLDTCVYEDRLYLTYSLRPQGLADTPSPAARPMIVAYDLVQGKLVGEPRPLPPLLRRVSPLLGPLSPLLGPLPLPLPLQLLGPSLAPMPEHAGASASGGALAVAQGRVWVAWVQAWTEHGGRREQVLLAPYTEAGGLGEAHPWEGGPARFLDGVSLTAFGDELFLAGATPPATDRPGETERLLAVRSDGLGFYGQQVLGTLGHSRGLRGVQVGDSLCFAYQSDAAYPTRAGRYQDLMLSVLRPRSRDLTTTTYVGDKTCNTRPDLVALGGKLYLTYVKYRRGPGGAARAYGIYIGRIGTALPAPAVAAQSEKELPVAGAVGAEASGREGAGATGAPAKR
jgi:hypothetical protein